MAVTVGSKLVFGHHGAGGGSAPAKRRRAPTEADDNDDDGESYTIQVHGRDNYDILCRIRDSLELAALIPQNQIDSYKQQQAELYKQ